MVGDLPCQVVEPHRAAGRARRVRPDREEAEVVVVLAVGGPHEHGPPAEGRLDDLETEDPAVELGGRRGVAHVQDCVVEACDRDAHPCQKG